MAEFLPPVVAVLTADIGEFVAKMDEAKGKMASTDAEMGGMGAGARMGLLAVGAAVVGVGYEAVKLGTQFQATMELLATQANVPQSQIAGLSRGVLALAGQVGFAPDSLAQALYHIESSFASVGITGPQALNLLKVAAEGAAVGHADLVDVTNALDAAVVSGIPGVQNLQQAMGVLNATVGTGDMSMQDLADAFSSGLLATVKGFGLSITDVGSALAVFGDNNMRGSVAATELRMAVEALAKPAATSGGELDKLGLSSTTLAKDMQTGGLLKAMEDLKKHMDAAGISATQQGQVLTDLFGKKAGTGINVLYDQLDRLKSKYPELTKSAAGFGDAWAKTKDTFSQAMKSAGATIDSLLVRLGERLLPVLTRVAEWFTSSVGWLERHRAVLAVLAGLVGGALVGALYAAVTATIAWTAALDVNPVFLIIAAIGALVGGLIYAYNHFATFRNIVDAVGRFFKSVWQDAVHLAGEAIAWFMNGPMVWIRARLAEFQVFWKAHGQQIIQVAKETWTLIWTTIQVAWDLLYGIIKTGLDVLLPVWKVAWDVIKGAVVIAWNYVKDIVTTGWHFVLNAIGLFADLLTGKWGKLWGDVKKLVGQLVGDIGKIVSDWARGAIHLLEEAGKDVLRGLINGMKSIMGDVVRSAGDIGHAVLHGIKGALGISSPSKEMRKVGQFIGQGLVLGITDGHAAAASAMRGLAGSALAGFGAPGVTAGGGMLPGGLAAGALGGAPTQLTVKVYLDGKELQGANRRSTLQYNARNSRNNLTLTGFGG